MPISKQGVELIRAEALRNTMKLHLLEKLRLRMDTVTIKAAALISLISERCKKAHSLRREAESLLKGQTDGAFAPAVLHPLDTPFPIHLRTCVRCLVCGNDLYLKFIEHT